MGVTVKIRVLALIVLLLLIVTQSTCTYTYRELKPVSEIVIKDRQITVKKIDDPMIISKLVEFINKRREGWIEPITGFPSTKVYIELYRDGQYIGSFGVTENSFSMQRTGEWRSKPATEQEVQEQRRFPRREID